MRLAEFILENVEPILAEWELFARSLSPGAKMTVVQLRDDAKSILLATARDMQQSQSLAQQASKSKGDDGKGGAESDRLDHASELHGEGRVSSGFHITDMVAEYRALRASVLRLWRKSRPHPDLNDLDDITRFDESMDQSLAKAVNSYAKRIDQSRHMFLAILGHDLRNPLNIATSFFWFRVKLLRTCNALWLLSIFIMYIVSILLRVLKGPPVVFFSRSPSRAPPQFLYYFCQAESRTSGT